MTDIITLPRAVIQSTVDKLAFYKGPKDQTVKALRAALAQQAEQAGQAELNTLLHEIDTQCGNGMIPWPIEDAFAAYEKAVAAAPKGGV